MPTLSKHQIIEYLKRGELLSNPSRKEDGEYDVEPASYDLRAGIFIWKEIDRNNGLSQPKSKRYNPNLPLYKQEYHTLQPGQVMFVITYEEVKMPKNLCGTVYAKNKFSREGILALTTGHIDPGVQCPIVIRLINLRSIPYTFHLGEPIYTIVFRNLECQNIDHLCSHQAISMDLTYERTMDSANMALGNLYDLSLTNDFVRKDDFGKLFWKMIRANIYKVCVWSIAALVALLTIIGGVVTLFDWIKGLGK